MPTETPSGAVGVGDEYPPGTTMEGKPVTDPRTPYQHDRPQHQKAHEFHRNSHRG
jgi:hypothetical protein